MLRTGQWSGKGPEVWQETQLGGSDTYRPLQDYTADYHTFGTKVFSMLHSNLSLVLWGPSGP